MKKMISILLSAVCLFSFAACAADADEGQGETHGQKDWGVTLSVKDVTATGLTLVLYQEGGVAEGELEIGSEYWIEKNENGKWINVQPLTEPVWDMMAIVIPSGDTLEWDLDWSWLYGELGAGTYRLCKNIVDFKESGAAETQFYCAEFEIKG